VRPAERLRVRVAFGEDPWTARRGNHLVGFRARVWRVADVRISRPWCTVYLVEAAAAEGETIVEWDPPSLRRPSSGVS